MSESTSNEFTPNKERGYYLLPGADYLGTDRASLFLVSKGIKPATILELLHNPGDQQYDERKYELDIEECELIIKDLGLPYKSKRFKEKSDYERQIFLVGKDQENLENLIKAEEDEETFNSDYYTFSWNLGRALGYPETAISADANRNALHPREYPQEIVDNLAYPFLVFALSRDHWKEEMELVKQQAEYIKKEDSELYEAILQN